MVCRLSGAKPLPEQMLTNIGPLGTNFIGTWTEITELGIHKNAFENVFYEMAAILSSTCGAEVGIFLKN